MKKEHLGPSQRTAWEQGRDELREALRNAADLIWEHHEIGFIRRAYEQGAGSCELCKDSRLLNIGKVLEKYDQEYPVPSASPTKECAHGKLMIEPCEPCGREPLDVDGDELVRMRGEQSTAGPALNEEEERKLATAAFSNYKFQPENYPEEEIAARRSWFTHGWMARARSAEPKEK